MFLPCKQEKSVRFRQQALMVLDEKNSLWQHRVSMIEEMGFSAPDATKLEKAIKTVIVVDRHGQPRRYEVPISWHDVAKLIEAGATQEQVLRILL